MSNYRYPAGKTDTIESPIISTDGTILRPPEPGSESVGPAMMDLVREVRRAQHAQAELLKESINLLTRDRYIVEKTSFSLSGIGVGVAPIYRVPMGNEVIISRLNLEGADANQIFTPGNPFSSAGSYIFLFEGDRIFDTAQNRIGLGNVIDFLPNPPSAVASPLLPAVITDGVSQAGVFRGGQTISVHVQGGPANGTIWARMQGILRTI